MAEVVPSALGQALYLSPEFSALTVETRDYRLHPVLGGISSTRWHAYQRFERRQSYLVEQLANQPMAASALQLVGKTGDGSAGPEPPKSWAIQRVQSKKARLKEQGNQHTPPPLLLCAVPVYSLISLQGLAVPVNPPPVLVSASQMQRAISKVRIQY